MDGASLYSVAVLADHLIRLFILCGSLADAKETFARVSKPTVHTWNAIISAHITLSDCNHGLLLYCIMQQQGVEPNRVTFLSVLKACSILGSIRFIQQAHGEIIFKGLESDVIISNMLIDVYSKCGNPHEARSVFDNLQCQQDVVSWNAMIAGYAHHGFGIAALDLYAEMQERGLWSDNATYSSILKACGSIGAVHQGRQIHDKISKEGLLCDIIIGGTLIDMYVKCGELKEARLVFDSLPSCDEVSWGTMIAGYTHHGHGFPALELFGEMQQKRLQADKGTYLCVLKACGLVGATEEGRLAHRHLINQNLESDLAISNALVDMYAHCSSLEDACEVFDTLSSPDIVSWSAMISGYAERSKGAFVHKSLATIKTQGSEPDSTIFMGILSACSHGGFLDEGCLYFKSMTETYHIMPTIEHYNCMVDLLCRAGHLDEAEGLLLTMPIRPDDFGWTSLTTGHRVYIRMKPAVRSVDQTLEMHPRGISTDVRVKGKEA